MERYLVRKGKSEVEGTVTGVEVKKLGRPPGKKKERKKVLKKPKPRGYWTKERVLAQAKKYKTAKNWRKHCSGSYRIAQKMGWIVEARDKYLTRMTKFITKEDVFKEALKYNRRVDFQKKSPSYYAKALNKGWVEECCSHMMSSKESKEHGRFYRWTEKSIMKEIKKMKKWSEIQDKLPGMYDAILRLNLKEKIKPMLKFGNQTKWTYDSLRKEALKYDTKKEFNDCNAGALRKIYKEGLSAELLSHMKTEEENRTFWTHEKLVKVIKECKTRNNLHIKYPGAYARIKNKKLDYAYLFEEYTLKIEKHYVHPRIFKMFNDLNIKFSYEKSLKLENKKVIPDFVYQKDKKIIIVEAKTSGCWATSSFHEIDNQVKNQIKAVKKSYPNLKIIHILVSEEGRIKSKYSNLNLSLKELRYYLKNDKYKKMKNKNKISLRQLSFNIRNKYRNQSKE